MSLKAETSICRCGKENDRMTGATTDELPTEGDVSVCIACGALNVITSAHPIRIRPATDLETREILASEQGDTIRKLQIMIAGI